MPVVLAACRPQIDAARVGHQSQSVVEGVGGGQIAASLLWRDQLVSSRFFLFSGDELDFKRPGRPDSRHHVRCEVKFRKREGPLHVADVAGARVEQGGCHEEPRFQEFALVHNV